MKNSYYSFFPLVFLFICQAGKADDSSGEKSYQTKCASCHGLQGEGVKGKFSKKLNGTLSVLQLAKVIQETMPQKSPGSLKIKEAQEIAQYIHAKLHYQASFPVSMARIDLTHLTATQHQNAVSDLIAALRAKENRTAPMGLQGEYFKGRNFNNGEKILTRVDPEVNFDFQTNSPVPDKIEPYEFTIRWTGSLLASETGIYDFALRTDHAFRLWINNDKQPLIDGWVKSGKETEFFASLKLLGGKVYPIRLEFSKAKQGVNDSNKNPKPPVKPAFIRLWWKPPFGALEPIPSRHLLAKTNPEVFVLSTPFPPVDRSRGWERGVGFSSEWEVAVREAALETTSFIVSKLDDLSKVSITAPDRKIKLSQFVKKIGSHAFSSPWSPNSEKEIDKIFSETNDTEIAVKKALLSIFLSPRFLYTRLPGADVKEGIPRRLALDLWDSLPTLELMGKFASQREVTPQFIGDTAREMLKDPRARQKIKRFFHALLNVEHIADIQKEKSKFPNFNEALLSEMRISLDLFVDDVFYSSKSSYSELLLSKEIFLTQKIGDFLNLKVKSSNDFVKVKGDDLRAGIVTHPYLLSVLAYPGESSPIHRGVFLARGLLGVGMKPPPEAVAPLSPSLHPSLTTRERVEAQTRPAACSTCHGIINPLGFSLENFDAGGRVRLKDNDKPINAKGFYLDREGKTHQFSTPMDLASFIAKSRDAQEAFAEKAFHHVTHQPVLAYGNQTMKELLPITSEINMREIFVRAAVLDTLRINNGQN